MKFDGAVGEVFCWGPRNKPYKNKNGVACSSPHASAALYTDKEIEAEKPRSRAALTLAVLDRVRLDSDIKSPLLLTFPRCHTHSSLPRTFRVNMLLTSVFLLPHDRTSFSVNYLPTFPSVLTRIFDLT